MRDRTGGAIHIIIDCIRDHTPGRRQSQGGGGILKFIAAINAGDGADHRAGGPPRLQKGGQSGRCGDEILTLGYGGIGGQKRTIDRMKNVVFRQKCNGTILHGITLTKLPHGNCAAAGGIKPLVRKLAAMIC